MSERYARVRLGLAGWGIAGAIVGLAVACSGGEEATAPSAPRDRWVLRSSTLQDGRSARDLLLAGRLAREPNRTWARVAGVERALSRVESLMLLDRSLTAAASTVAPDVSDVELVNAYSTAWLAGMTTAYFHVETVASTCTRSAPPYQLSQQSSVWGQAHNGSLLFERGFSKVGSACQWDLQDQQSVGGQSASCLYAAGINTTHALTFVNPIDDGKPYPGMAPLQAFTFDQQFNDCGGSSSDGGDGSGSGGSGGSSSGGDSPQPCVRVDYNTWDCSAATQ